MKIVTAGTAGTLESSDIMVTIMPGRGGIEIELESSVEKQFGAAIRTAIRATLARAGVTDAVVRAVDRGALDCAVQARTLAAAYRAAQCTDYRFEEV